MSVQASVPHPPASRRPLLSKTVRWLALLALCGAYIQGGLVKLLDFAGAQAEMRHLGLHPPALMAGAVIALELGASAPQKPFRSDTGSLLAQAPACWCPCTLQSFRQAQAAAASRSVVCKGLPSLSPQAP